MLGYTRSGAGRRVLVLANFSEFAQACAAPVFSAMPAEAIELIGERPRRLRNGLTLAPYEVLWLDCSA